MEKNEQLLLVLIWGNPTCVITADKKKECFDFWVKAEFDGDEDQASIEFKKIKVNPKNFEQSSL